MDIAPLVLLVVLAGGIVVATLWVATLRTQLRTGLLAGLVGLLQVAPGSVIAPYAVALPGGVSLTPANTIIAGVFFVAVVLTALERDAHAARLAITVVLVAGLVEVGLLASTSWALDSGQVTVLGEQDPATYDTFLGVLLAGTPLAALEVALFVYLIERVRRRQPTREVLAAAATLLFALVLLVDGLVFSAAATLLEPDLTVSVIGGVQAKAVLAVLYGVPLLLFLQRSPRAHQALSLEPLRVRDIFLTDTHELARRFSESQQRFQRLAEKAQDVIYRVEMSDPPELVYVSPAVETLLGITPDELYGDPRLGGDILAASGQLHLLDRVRDPHGSHGDPVARITRPDGRTVWVEERHTHVFDDGEHVATEGVVRDVTNRIRLEQTLRDGLAEQQARNRQLHQLDQMKNMFLNAVSHELRTPLSAVKGIALTVTEREAELDAGTREHLLSRLIANAERLHELLDDLLDVDRLTRGIITPDLERHDVGGLARDVAASMDVADRPLSVSSASVHALVDGPKVARIIENLISNAVRHTGDGVPVWLRVEPEDGGVGIWVEDAGDGISDEMKEQIFTPFVHGDSAAARVSGLGIGLSLVQSFVDLHDGRVEVGERDGGGGGASFHVWLPEDPHARPGPTPRAAASAGAAGPARDVEGQREAVPGS